MNEERFAKMRRWPIPQRMKHRPKYKGVAIPYTVMIDEKTHVPDFKVNMELRRVLCILDKRCAMCGQKMNHEISFIGGGNLLEGAAAIDPGMHPGCATYAWNVCPYLVYGRGHAEHIRARGPPRQRRSHNAGRAAREDRHDDDARL